MKIPTIQASESARTGSTGPQASPLAFGADATALGAGIQNFAEGAGSAALHIAQATRLQKAQESEQWVAEAVAPASQKLNAWLKDDNNVASPDYVEKFLEQSKAVIDETAGNAPSKEAERAFRRHMLAFQTTKQEQALHTSAAVRVDKAVASVGTQTEGIMAAYTEAKLVPNGNPTGELMQGINRTVEYIDKTFGTIAPNKARQLKEKMASDVAIGAADDHTDWAKHFVQSTPYLDEQSRASLLKHIETIASHKDIGNRIIFAEDADMAIQAAKKGEDYTKFSDKVWRNFYPNDWQERKAHHDSIIDAHREANTFAESVKGFGPAALQSETEKFLKSRETSTQIEAGRNVLTLANDAIREIYSDPAGYITRNNPVVGQFNRKVQSAASNPELLAKAVVERNAATLRYQGPPPVGTPEDQKAYYLNLDSNATHLISRDEAKGIVAEVEKGQYTEGALQTLLQSVKRTPDRVQQQQIWNDLVNLGGLPPSYQLIMLMDGRRGSDVVTAALRNSKQLHEMKLPDKDFKNIEDTITNSETWRNLSRALANGDSGERVGDLAGYLTSVKTVALQYVAMGKTTTEAANLAVGLIKDRIAFPKVNGYPMAIERDRPKGAPWSDDEVKHLGRRLTETIGTLPVEQIDERPFAFMQNLLGARERPERMHRLRAHLAESAFWMPEVDGQSATLYSPDDSGGSFQVRDVYGRPIKVGFEQLMNNFIKPQSYPFFAPAGELPIY